MLTIVRSHRTTTVTTTLTYGHAPGSPIPYVVWGCPDAALSEMVRIWADFDTGPDTSHHCRLDEVSALL